jgi:hypothetical protein
LIFSSDPAAAEAACAIKFFPWKKKMLCNEIADKAIYFRLTNES